jgi:hypothetical protein|tara:strand:+ start:43 stop:1539 length:1497 start_codon:yes stop_codon:yes gene_type:complete
MPEPGMGSKGSRSGAGMGGGGGYAGADLDWGSSPEGSEGTTAVKMRSFYMDDDPEYESSKQKSIAPKISSALEQKWEPTKTVSSWAKPYEKISNTELTKRILQAHANYRKTPYGQHDTSAYTRPNHFRVGYDAEMGGGPSTWGPSKSVSGWAQHYKASPTTSLESDEIHPLMVAGLKYGLKPDEIAKIMQTENPGILGSYQRYGDKTRINIHPDFGKRQPDLVGTPMHELAGHRLLNELEYEDWWEDVKRTDFLNKQLPDVQTIYETGGSQIAPAHVAPYGFDPTQGEMVTSRAATVEDLLNLNAPIHEGSSGLYGSDWRNFAEYMKENPVDWSDAQYNPNKNLTDLEEFGYDRELARQYENYVRFNQELPDMYHGGDYWSPLNKTYKIDDITQGLNQEGLKRTTGLRGWPMGSHHFLVDRLMARNPKLSSGHAEGLKRALTNELNAALANPESTINKLGDLGLADQFWDYVEDYLSRESENWSPSKAREELQRLLGG